MPVPPPARDNLHTEMRLTAVLEMLNDATRALQTVIAEVRSSNKPPSDAAHGADLSEDGPQE